MIQAIGGWLILDGIWSIKVYLNAVDSSGKKLQTWGNDHWMRVFRILAGIGLIIWG